MKFVDYVETKVTVNGVEETVYVKKEVGLMDKLKNSKAAKIVGIAAGVAVGVGAAYAIGKHASKDSSNDVQQAMIPNQAPVNYIPQYSAPVVEAAPVDYPTETADTIETENITSNDDVTF